jgi:hypothetical protein
MSITRVIRRVCNACVAVLFLHTIGANTDGTCCCHALGSCAITPIAARVAIELAIPAV